MSPFDYFILTLLIVSSVYGIYRGIIKEVLSLSGLVLSFYLASNFDNSLANIVPIENKSDFLIISAFIMIFVSTLIFTSILIKLISKVLKLAGLSIMNRFFGFFFGIARGLVIVLVIPLPKSTYSFCKFNRPCRVQTHTVFRSYIFICFRVFTKLSVYPCRIWLCSHKGGAHLMCGVIGIVSNNPVNQMLYDGLLVLQHRGQDAAGIVTTDGNRFYMHKNNGLVKDVFQTRHMRNLIGNAGIAHVRYPTAGSSSAAEAQPFYVNSPYGIVLGHNGNLTNSSKLKQDMFKQDLRHINTNSDSEVLINVLAHELVDSSKKSVLTTDMIFDAVTSLYSRCSGAFAVVSMIANFGLLAFRDPHGIRPLVVGKREMGDGPEYIVASESVALDVLGFELLRDVEPGEAIFIDLNGNFYSKKCVSDKKVSPCIFEYVYLARPDSVIDGVSVYQTRLNMGEH